MVKGLSEQIQLGRGVAEASQGQQLAEKVETLTKTIADQREAQLQGSVDSLRSELGDVRQKLNTEPTGKTTEDLISLGIPVLAGKIDNAATMIGSELKGIREQVGDGKLLTLTPPANAQKAAADPLKTAQQIAGAVALEDEILKAEAVSSGR